MRSATFRRRLPACLGLLCALAFTAPLPPMAVRGEAPASNGGQAAEDATDAGSAADLQPLVLEPARGADAPTVQLTPDGKPEPWNPLEIGDFSLVDQDGRTVTSADLRGKPWVASFIFTRCAFACPNLVKAIHDLNDRVRDVDVRFVTITVDPEHDTVEKMRQYAEIYGAEPDRWLFLTGEKAEVYRLIRHGFKVAAWEQFGTARLPGFEFAHSLSLVHVGPDGKVLGMYASGQEREVLALQRVLQGRMATPPENRPVPPAAVPEGQTPVALPPASRQTTGQLPQWAARLPTTNAMLNALATVLLLVGFAAIKARHVRLHARMMLMSFGVSIAFLACYLTYHVALQRFTGTHGKRFEGEGAAALLYYVILISHVILAATIPLLAPITIYLGLTRRWDRHRRVARITFPIWLYVSVTGVIIYGMLYLWPLAGSVAPS